MYFSSIQTAAAANEFDAVSSPTSKGCVFASRYCHVYNLLVYQTEGYTEKKMTFGTPAAETYPDEQTAQERGHR